MAHAENSDPEFAADLRAVWGQVSVRQHAGAVVHNVTAATRLLDVLPLVAADQRIQVIFSVIGSSTFTAGTEDFLLDRGAALIPWSRVPDHNVNLAIAASYGGNLQELQSPRVILVSIGCWPAPAARELSARSRR
ncbi:MAG: hypothetical protein ACRDQ4_08785 [Pseudonocardiaceae bacterium]